ncbi:MAG: crossover junction endodeoxyribonuclease RuvC [Candidatus Omnitrophota bacterium]
MRILGIDPGLGITGYGAIEVNPVRDKSLNGVNFSGIKLLEAGVIRTSAEEDLETRINKIYEGLKGLIEELRPEVLVLEKLYSHYKHPATAILMGHARGAICLLAKQSGVGLTGYSVTRVKKAITGVGNAGKYQVQGMIQNLLNLNVVPNPPDITDALALAIAHAHISQKEGVSISG